MCQILFHPESQYKAIINYVLKLGKAIIVLFRTQPTTWVPVLTMEIVILKEIKNVSLKLTIPLINQGKITVVQLTD
jgi:hypothetical protein